MIRSMSQGNRWCRASSKLSLITRFVCARTSFSTNVWWSLFLLLEWIHPSIDQQRSHVDTEHMTPETLYANQTIEHYPSPRHQNDTTYTMLSGTIGTVIHNLMWYTYWNTCFDPKASTKREYCDFSLLKSWPPGALEKSSITDQISVLTPWSICLRQNCLSITKSVEWMGVWKALHLFMKTLCIFLRIASSSPLMGLE